MSESDFSPVDYAVDDAGHEASVGESVPTESPIEFSGAAIQTETVREMGRMSVDGLGKLQSNTRASDEDAESPVRLVIASVHPIELFGVTFLVEPDDSGFLIHHSEYAISGEGETFEDAVYDLLHTARELKEYFASIAIDTLSRDGIEFRHFLLDQLVL